MCVRHVLMCVSHVVFWGFAVTADELKELREWLGWTQEQMAAALNTPLGTYRGWEQGRYPAPGLIDVACREIEGRKK